MAVQINLRAMFMLHLGGLSVIFQLSYLGLQILQTMQTIGNRVNYRCAMTNFT